MMSTKQITHVADLQKVSPPSPLQVFSEHPHSSSCGMAGSQKETGTLTRRHCPQGPSDHPQRAGDVRVGEGAGSREGPQGDGL